MTVLTSGGTTPVVSESLMICVRDGSRTSIHSCVRVAGIGPSSHDFGGVLLNNSQTTPEIQI